MQRYSRTPTAIESVLSANSPVKMDLDLFETYKVGSKLPTDAMQQICKKAVLQEISEFNQSEPTQLQRMIGADVVYDRKSNYYRQVWKFYLDNE